MLGEVKREEGAEEAMGAQAGEKVTINRGNNCDITSLWKYNYSTMVFDVEAQAITMYSESVFFNKCCKSGVKGWYDSVRLCCKIYARQDVLTHPASLVLMVFFEGHLKPI